MSAIIMTTSPFQTKLREVLGEKPTYQQFYTAYMELFRKNFPNSSVPSNNMLSFFYDDYIEMGEIIPY